jgi:hypothetical protein
MNSCVFRETNNKVKERKNNEYLKKFRRNKGNKIEKNANSKKATNLRDVYFICSGAKQWPACY